MLAVVIVLSKALVTVGAAAAQVGCMQETEAEGSTDGVETETIEMINKRSEHDFSVGLLCWTLVKKRPGAMTTQLNQSFQERRGHDGCMHNVTGCSLVYERKDDSGGAKLLLTHDRQPSSLRLAEQKTSRRWISLPQTVFSLVQGFLCSCC